MPQSHLDGEGCELLLVDGSLVDGVGHRQVDHFTNKGEKKPVDNQNTFTTLTQ